MKKLVCFCEDVLFATVGLVVFVALVRSAAKNRYSPRKSKP
jgi:hypothetical protein